MMLRQILGPAVAVLALLTAGVAAGAPRTLLFIGNSFTYGANSPLVHYRADMVTDINGEGIGGVPAVFAVFAKEAGLDYQVALETAPGKGLDWHWNARRDKLDRPWDEVVLQSYSTLDATHPGDPTLLVAYVKRWAEMLRARNESVRIYLDATWSRPDQTYPARAPWRGKPIEAMAQDIARGYRLAAEDTPGVVAVAPVGLAFNRAIAMGIADPDPYDGVAFGEIDLWSWDHYHASAYGYYLEALVLFGQITGKDPLSLGAHETVAEDMGFSATQTRALQQVAHDELAAR